jgi:hypothetical protein
LEPPSTFPKKGYFLRFTFSVSFTKINTNILTSFLISLDENEITNSLWCLRTQNTRYTIVFLSKFQILMEFCYAIVFLGNFK